MEEWNCIRNERENPNLLLKDVEDCATIVQRLGSLSKFKIESKRIERVNLSREEINNIITIESDGMITTREGT